MWIKPKYEQYYCLTLSTMLDNWILSPGSVSADWTSEDYSLNVSSASSYLSTPTVILAWPFPLSLRSSFIFSNLNNMLPRWRKKKHGTSTRNRDVSSKCHAIPNLHYLVQGPKAEEISIKRCRQIEMDIQGEGGVGHVLITPNATPIRGKVLMFYSDRQWCCTFNMRAWQIWN